MSEVPLYACFSAEHDLPGGEVGVNEALYKYVTGPRGQAFTVETFAAAATS
jgi:hypothetical protein